MPPPPVKTENKIMNSLLKRKSNPITSSFFNNKLTYAKFYLLVTAQPVTQDEDFTYLLPGMCALQGNRFALAFHRRRLMGEK